MTKDELREKANDLPLQPGVYLMMDKTGKVIYVDGDDVDSKTVFVCEVE